MLGTRVLSAVVLIPVVLFMLFFSPETTAIATGLASIISAYEFYDMSRKAPQRYRPVQLPGYVLAAFLSYAAYLKNVPLMLLSIGLLAIFSGIVILIRRRFIVELEEPPNRDWINWGFSVFGAIYAGLPLALATYLRTAKTDPIWWLVLALVGTWGADTGAYFVGRLIGKRPLAPKISPKKTVEGAIGGLITGIIAVSLVGVLALKIPVYITIPLGLLLGVGAILGDLFESWIKRRFNIKDSGKIIPGHGGILDRIDSLLVVITLTYLFTLVY